MAIACSFYTQINHHKNIYIKIKLTGLIVSGNGASRISLTIFMISSMVYFLEILRVAASEGMYGIIYAGAEDDKVDILVAVAVVVAVGAA